MKLYWKKAVAGFALAGMLAFTSFAGHADAASKEQPRGVECWLSQSFFDIHTQWIQLEDSQWATLLKKLQQLEEKETETAKPDQSEKKAEKKEEEPKQAEQPSRNADSPSNAGSGGQPSSGQGNGGGSSAESRNPGIQSIEMEVVNLVNQEREKRGLKPLKADTKLSQVARDKSQDMIDNNYFSHDSPRYGSPFDMMKAYGISYRTAAENIAAGQSTAKQVMDGWMNSDGHRANILNPNLDTIGVGYAKGGSYGHYWTQMFIQR
ncbi:CAP domain-containing protein [Desmospora profundinema]|uniref:YkwD family protein n=1 Tax=Desmospora profundinema TaxID=1571184 RepID=A0ABU1IH64_9BACL|nr:CAP domain-containing protein [Desmospora profundinema]MDR6224115.1 putative YkwD family protein [Desmospora profundinema]